MPLKSKLEELVWRIVGEYDAEAVEEDEEDIGASKYVPYETYRDFVDNLWSKIHPLQSSQTETEALLHRLKLGLNVNIKRMIRIGDVVGTLVSTQESHAQRLNTQVTSVSKTLIDMRRLENTFTDININLAACWERLNIIDKRLATVDARTSQADSTPEEIASSFAALQGGSDA